MTTPYSLLSCFVQTRNILRITAQIDTLKDAGSTRSQMMKWTSQANDWTYFSVPWHATQVVYCSLPEPIALAIGPDGIVSAGTIAGDQEEHVDASHDGPARRGPIRNLAVIADTVYAVGMGRQVYRREGPQQWTHQDEGVILPRGVVELCGFNALDGLDENNLFAVGFNGEIWQRSQTVWRQCASPTTVVLHQVKVVREDLMFACGQLGVLLRGDGAEWTVISQTASTNDFWGMAWFNDRLYLACDDGLFWLDEHDKLQLVDMRLPGKPSTRHLHAADGVLLSCGPKHLCVTGDGVSWRDITP